ncbi:hypothetical protein MMC14_005752 [Varicellaria rhodocarpa]|nr:hypothetical protein [Varicellaria rhodocarpa]
MISPDNGLAFAATSFKGSNYLFFYDNSNHQLSCLYDKGGNYSTNVVKGSDGAAIQRNRETCPIAAVTVFAGGICALTRHHSTCVLYEFISLILFYYMKQLLNFYYVDQNTRTIKELDPQYKINSPGALGPTFDSNSGNIFVFFMSIDSVPLAYTEAIWANEKWSFKRII